MIPLFILILLKTFKILNINSKTLVSSFIIMPINSLHLFYTVHQSLIILFSSAQSGIILLIYIIHWFILSRLRRSTSLCVNLRSTRFLDTSLLSGTIGLLTVVVVVNKSLIDCLLALLFGLSSYCVMFVSLVLLITIPVTFPFSMTAAVGCSSTDSRDPSSSVTIKVCAPRIFDSISISASTTGLQNLDSIYKRVEERIYYPMFIVNEKKN
ncbi:hypothetical protein AGLY_000557 [Aphis glycines]|uniref:Uncharacterized protein n=1 Tax=Aphis glycines TaxID=307491 RepID=A0A6G0U7G3_APHGL|nr:hypothetical protein AGLY_000557 [Aphis glycines]